MESLHLAYSCASWRVELASHSRSRRFFVPEQDAAPARASNELASSSTTPRDQILSSTPLSSQTIPPLAPLDTATNIAEDPFYNPSSILPPVFKISNFEKTECRAHGLDAEQPLQTACLIDADHVEKLRTTVRECG